MNGPTWQILPDPMTGQLTGPPGRPDFARSGAARSVRRGLLVPFRRDGKSDFASGTALELARSAVTLVLGTKCGSDFTQGELPWRTEFGSLMQSLRLQGNGPVLAALARSRVADALARWIPNIRVRAVAVRNEGEAAIVAIKWDLMDGSGQRVLVPGVETSVPVR